MTNNETLADAAITEQSSAVDNAAALREALEEQLRYWNTHVRDRSEEEMRVRTDAALSAPPRNCDVGTAEEQHRRFVDYCNECDCPMGCIHRKEFIGMLDTRCASMLKCYIRWAQMPYKKGGAE